MKLPDWKWILRNRVLHRRSYEPEVKRELLRVRGEVFVDVGAREGHYSLMLAKNFRRVYAIEPDSRVLPILWKKVRKAGNIRMMNLALSDRDGYAPFYQNPEGRPDGSLVFKGKQFVMVPVKTYDFMFGGEDVALVKIDVEGAEFLVLKGMEESLQKGRVKQVMVELHDRTRLDELERWLKARNYSVKRLDEHPRVLAGYSPFPLTQQHTYTPKRRHDSNQMIRTLPSSLMDTELYPAREGHFRDIY